MPSYHLELFVFDLQALRLRPRRLVFLSLPATILQACLAKLLEPQCPRPRLLVADVVLERHFAVVPAAFQTILFPVNFLFPSTTPKRLLS